MQGAQCSSSVVSAQKEHPSYFLVDDKGFPVMSGTYPQLDYRQPEVQQWWASIPLSIGPDATRLIDGILADGSGPRALVSSDFANFTMSERAALANGSLAALQIVPHLPSCTRLYWLCI